MKKNQNPLETIVSKVGSQREVVRRINDIAPEGESVSPSQFHYWMKEGVPLKWVDLVCTVGGGSVSPNQLMEWRTKHQLETRFKRKKTLAAH